MLRVESKTSRKCTCDNPTSKLHVIPTNCNNPVKLLDRPAHLGEMASPAWTAEAMPEMWGGWAGKRQGSQSKVSGYCVLLLSTTMRRVTACGWSEEQEAGEVGEHEEG